MELNVNERGNYTTVNVPLNVAKKIDHILAEQGYSSRSELVRDAIRQSLKKLEKDKEAET